MERDWARGSVISLRERAGVYVAKGGYFYALRHLWHTWPREQTLVLESAAVWARRILMIGMAYSDLIILRPPMVASASTERLLGHQMTRRAPGTQGHSAESTPFFA